MWLNNVSISQKDHGVDKWSRAGAFFFLFKWGKFETLGTVCFDKWARTDGLLLLGLEENFYHGL